MLHSHSYGDMIAVVFLYAVQHLCYQVLGLWTRAPFYKLLLGTVSSLIHVGHFYICWVASKPFLYAGSSTTAHSPFSTFSSTYPYILAMSR